MISPPCFPSRPKVPAALGSVERGKVKPQGGQVVLQELFGSVCSQKPDRSAAGELRLSPSREDVTPTLPFGCRMGCSSQPLPALDLPQHPAAPREKLRLLNKALAFMDGAGSYPPGSAAQPGSPKKGQRRAAGRALAVAFPESRLAPNCLPE